jgi:vancomycin permeability regulator SanA
METNNEKAFTDWLYNRYVEAVRKNDYRQMSIYLDLLNRCVSMMTQRKFSRLRRLARERIKAITIAYKSGKLKKLLLAGEEGVTEFETAMADYEKKLRKMYFPEERIKEMLIEKRMNYGND